MFNGMRRREMGLGVQLLVQVYLDTTEIRKKCEAFLIYPVHADLVH